MKVFVPFIDKTYPVRAEAGGRLLLGFSKSGWGAYSLRMRHPDLFGKAAAWDAPLIQENFDAYRSPNCSRARPANCGSRSD
ncbi:MAG TPA: alpha/beta hydrolase-fold protein [Urbifossiella sp.]